MDQASVEVIRGGTLFDSRSGTLVPDATVVIEGERLRAVGTPEHPVQVPRGARRIDARGKFLLPGLIDGHVHLVHILDSAQVTGAEILPLFLAKGVTSVRDTGDEIVAQKVVAQYAEALPDRCPRVFLSSPLLDTDPPFHPRASRVLTDPDQVPGFVEEMVRWGVGTLKIYVGLSRPLAREIIAEGHRRGLKVTAHLGAYSAQEAIADGIDCLEHIWAAWHFLFPSEPPEVRERMDLDHPTAQALIASLAERQVMLSPTLTVFRNMILLSDLPEVREHPDNAFVPERLRERWRQDPASSPPPETRERRRREFAKYQELTGLLYRAGVPLLAGTDTPEPFVPPGFSLHQELELLVQSGLPPAAALQAATLHNAQALGQERNLGSLEAGKLADLVILEANPLEDIRNTRKIFRVFRGGRAVDPRALWGWVNGDRRNPE